MRLRCLSNYRNDPRALVFVEGTEFDIDDEIAEFLMRDAPGVFTIAAAKKADLEIEREPESEPKPKQARTRNKQVEAAPKDK